MQRQTPIAEARPIACLKDQFCILFFCPRTRPRTFLNCFALELNVLKTKQLRNVLGRVLGPENYIQNPSFSHHVLIKEHKSAGQVS